MSLKVLVMGDPAWPELLPLLSPFKWYLDLLQTLHLPDPRYASAFPGVQQMPAASHPFACARVHDMQLAHWQRLRFIGCGCTAKLIRMLTSNSNGCYEAGASEGFRSKLMQSVSRRLGSQTASFARDRVVAESQQLLDAGQRSDALRHLQRATFFGHLPSRANLSWLLVQGKAGVDAEQQTAFDLAEQGARLGCCHCQGVLAWCHLFLQPQSPLKALELARASSGKGSRYGQYVLGCMHQHGAAGLALNNAEAVSLYRLAASQRLDAAQRDLGFMHFKGWGVVADAAEAVRCYLEAAAQGDAAALNSVAECLEAGRGISMDIAAATAFYERASAAGCETAAGSLRALRESVAFVADA